MIWIRRIGGEAAEAADSARFQARSETKLKEETFLLLLVQQPHMFQYSFLIALVVVVVVAAAVAAVAAAAAVVVVLDKFGTLSCSCEA